MIFECGGVEKCRSRSFSQALKFELPQKEDKDLLKKMQNFLGQDGSHEGILERRGMYINKLRTEWLDLLENKRAAPRKNKDWYLLE